MRLVATVDFSKDRRQTHTPSHGLAKLSRAAKNTVRFLSTSKEPASGAKQIFLTRFSRRDGSPFMNLLMIAPLLDSRGTTRYCIGAQVDVSGLVKECTDLEGLQRLLKRQSGEMEEEAKKDEFQELSEMLNVAELDTVRKTGGRMHREQTNDIESESTAWHQPRLLLKDPSPDANTVGKSYLSANSQANGRLEGVYQNVSAYPTNQP